MQVIKFRTRDFMGSIDIGHLSKVIALPRLNLAPQDKDYIVGYVNIAGDVIPVIDLSVRLHGEKPNKYNINTPILVCKKSSGKIFGAIVETIDDIVSVSDDMIQKQGQIKKAHGFYKGKIRFNDETSMLIDVDKLVDDND